jgi:hypothetical protein
MKLLDSFELLAAFSAIAVYDPLLAVPYNNWSKQHVQQGFTWQPGSVSFATIGSVEVATEIWLSNTLELLVETQRAVQVPFSVGEQNQIGVAGIGGIDKIVEVPSGTYNVLFENGFRYDVECDEEDDELGLRPMWCRITFVASQSPQAAILRDVPGLPEGQLTPTYPLFMKATPVDT